MDNINFSNDHFRKMVKQLQATPQSLMESKYEKPIKEAVPFEKNALDEIDPSTLETGKEYTYSGTIPGKDQGQLKLKFVKVITDENGKNYNYFTDEKNPATSGQFGEFGVETYFTNEEVESEGESYDEFLERFRKGI